MRGRPDTMNRKSLRTSRCASVLEDRTNGRSLASTLWHRLEWDERTTRA